MIRKCDESFETFYDKLSNSRSQQENVKHVFSFDVFNSLSSENALEYFILYHDKSYDSQTAIELMFQFWDKINEAADACLCFIIVAKQLGIETVLHFIPIDDLMELIRNNPHQYTAGLALYLIPYVNATFFPIETIIEQAGSDEYGTFLQLFVQQHSHYYDIPIEAYTNFLPYDNKTIKEKEALYKLFKLGMLQYPNLMPYVMELAQDLSEIS